MINPEGHDITCCNIRCQEHIRVIRARTLWLLGLWPLKCQKCGWLQKPDNVKFKDALE